MNISEIELVKFKDGKYCPNSLKYFTKEKEGVLVLEDKIIAAPAVALDKSIDKRFYVIKTYTVNGRFIVYVKEGELYEIFGGGVKKLCAGLKEPPMLLPIEYKGKQGFVVICCNLGKIITDATFDFAVPCGTTCEIFGDYLFIGKGRKIFLLPKEESGALKAKDFSFLYLDAKYGAVERFVKTEDSLVIFRKRGISELSYSDSLAEFKIKNLETVPIACDGQTVKKIGNTIYFINKLQGFCGYKGGSVFKVDCNFNLKNYTVIGEAAEADNLYVLSVNDQNGKRKFYVYDGIAKNDFFVDAESLLFCDGGYVFNYNLNAYGSLVKEKSCAKKWQSHAFDFGEDGAKTLYKIKIKSSGKALLKVKGKYESRSFTLNSGNNILSTRVFSDGFIVELFSEEKDFCISELSFFYRK